ncbi:MAG: hypothetical protein OEL81_02420 [Nitrosopumilus sp.]|nr:hypothetical protein [Nitrosopumilus sp.]
MQFQELSDSQWSTISPHLPKPARTGKIRNLEEYENRKQGRVPTGIKRCLECNMLFSADVEILVWDGMECVIIQRLG